jgi:phosphoribosylformimino-5-aminoimidazole carboxamide ribotide isomerase
VIILPAIDLIDGQCVRLTRGAYDTAEQVAAEPLQTADSFAAAGARWIHMVDLDGAKAGAPVNQDVILAVARAGKLQVEVGGGIRTAQDAALYMDGGAARVILGSVALTEPALVRELVAQYGERIAVGIDARDGFVRTAGWLAESRVHFTDLAREMAAAGVKTIIYTDIGRDGTLSGPNLEELAAVRDAAPGVGIIASGGIRNLADVQACQALELDGVILGKSIYKGTIDLKEVIALC